MIPTGFRPLPIDGTAPCPGIEKDTVATRHSGKGKGLGFRMKMLDQMFFHQPFCYVLEILIQLKLIHQFHSYQIRRLYFNREPAAGSGTVVAQSFIVLCPGCCIINICLDER
jgi:hypothetical protein